MAQQLKVPRFDYYEPEFRVAQKLATTYGGGALAKAYFDGDFNSLKRSFKGNWDEFAIKLEASDWAWLRSKGYL